MTWIRDVFRRRALERDLAEEIRQHLDEKVDDLMLQGISRDEATRRARREFGNSTLVKEDVRVAWGWTRWEQFAGDVRHGLRQVRRNPAFSAIAIATLRGAARNTNGKRGGHSTPHCSWTPARLRQSAPV